MQTNLADFIRNTPDGDEADAILHKCVHCGFCTATCPTYQLLGDELDGPRGRIYLIKQMVEGAPVTRSTQLHLDRCLTCRNCETTCPSGVQYGRLVEIGRKLTEEKVARPPGQRLLRRLLASAVPNSAIFTPTMRLAQHFRRVLPKKLRDKVPARQRPLEWPTAKHTRKMLMLAGCVQPSMMPNVNIATARVLDALGVETVIAADAGCCGAIRLHLGYNDEALDDMRANIDAWWPYVEQGVEAIVMNASGCGATVKEYAHLLRHDPVYAEKAHRIVELTRDIAEILPDFEEALTAVTRRRSVHTVAFHPPCTLQHGQQVRGKVEQLLSALGVEVRLPADSHLCCGSAGTYSLTQPRLSYALRDQKLDRLQAQEPQVIVSANVGCIAHLQSGTSTPVAHWIELVEHMLSV
ncbi:glycolate oxidase iron-sulfur subunit [Paraburkholderia ribeironis]|uniref:Glycolate oxidase iron-sulfur subunit n=1 Tax=Paraburkholderia ribeironis TaxID=1247936 RepID=A0A1N7S5L3_9BURK|nr:glycolate oxidase subunit GlcF [Paraburkholderia ribeironis]SIT42648.1 glycolate oxidase iron-sulfur subunit [Paraburkholderia ribeironis]